MLFNASVMATPLLISNPAFHTDAFDPGEYPRLMDDPPDHAIFLPLSLPNAFRNIGAIFSIIRTLSFVG